LKTLATNTEIVYATRADKLLPAIYPKLFLNYISIDRSKPFP